MVSPSEVESLALRVVFVNITDAYDKSRHVHFIPSLPIFIEIGLYLTNKEQKITWHVFWDTVYIRKFQLTMKLNTV